MQFHERLMDLLGHDVSVHGRAEASVKEIGAGVLKEVGPDYLIIGTTRQHKGGGPEDAVDWWFKSDKVVAVVHASDCPKCLATE